MPVCVHVICSLMFYVLYLPNTSCCGNHLDTLTLAGKPVISSFHFQRILCGNRSKTRRIACFIYSGNFDRMELPKLKYIIPCSPEPEMNSSSSCGSGFPGLQWMVPISTMFGINGRAKPMALFMFTNNTEVLRCATSAGGVPGGKY